MKKKRNLVLALVLLCAIAVTGSIVVGTLAKYTSTVSGGGSAEIAKWAFSDDNQVTNMSFNLENTYDSSTLVNGKIAPGTQGSFSIDLSNVNSDVGVDYTVSLELTDAPTNLKLYSDSAYSTEITDIAPLTGRLSVGETTTVYVYWKWEYYTSDDNDQIDTNDGYNASDSGMTVNATITGTQVAPQAQ